MSCHVKMIVRKGKFPCPIYDLKRCSIEGYIPSCQVLDSTPRNPCPEWSCEALPVKVADASSAPQPLTVRNKFENLLKVVNLFIF